MSVLTKWVAFCWRPRCVTGKEAHERAEEVLAAAEVPVSGLYTHARDIEDYFIGLMGGTSSVRSCSTECTVKGGEGNA